MSLHVAILKPVYLQLLLDGVKTVESRLTRTRQPPFGHAAEGERIYFKQSGGPFRAMARVHHVESFADFTPEQFDRLEQRLRPMVGGDDAYWQSKRCCRYATFLHLAEVESIDVGPAFAPSAWKAWHVLDDSADPVKDFPLTDGALRNGYLSVASGLPAASHADNPTQPSTLRLLLPDGEQIQTDLYQGRRIRWRGWRRYFQAHKLHAGDAVRLVALGDQQYRVAWISKATQGRRP